MIDPTGTDIGKEVIYKPSDMIQMLHDETSVTVCSLIESGVITSFNREYVFVRYGADKHSKATRRIDLFWAHS